MPQEIEVDRKVACATRYRGNGEPAWSEVKRNLPPMGFHRRKREARFANDLQPHMQRRVSVAPLGEGQRWSHGVRNGHRQRNPGAGSSMTSST